MCQCQYCGLARVEFKPQRLVDRHFNGRCGRPAAKGQDHRKTGEAEQENDDDDTGQEGADSRPFDKTKELSTGHTERAGCAPVFCRNLPPGGQQQPDRERQVKEGMCQQNAGQAINFKRYGKAHRLKHGMQQSSPPVDGHDAEYGDNDRHDQG